MNALEVKGLCKNYASFALQDVSFYVEEGSITGFLGRNGAGKSTVLKCIAGLVHPNGGEIRIFGKPAHDTGARESLGVMFGGMEIYPYKRIGQIRRVYAAFWRDWDEGEYRRLAAQFCLDEKKRFRELSNGMKTKFLLALACSHGAGLLILDEPTSGLDPVSRAEIITFLRGFVREKRRAVFFSTQIVSDLEQCADHIVYIRGGKIVRADETRSYLSDCTNLQGTMSALEAYFLKEEGFCEESSV